MGVLTQFLFEHKEYHTTLIEIDKEAIAYLKEHFVMQKEQMLEGDFLAMNLKTLFSEPVAIIGNFPYNISTQILFKILENRITFTVLKELFGKNQRWAGNRDILGSHRACCSGLP